MVNLSSVVEWGWYLFCQHYGIKEPNSWLVHFTFWCSASDLQRTKWLVSPNCVVWANKSIWLHMFRWIILVVFVMKEKFNPCTIEALFNKTSCLNTEQHKHDGLTKTSPLTCTWALNYTGSTVIKDWIVTLSLQSYLFFHPTIWMWLYPVGAFFFLIFPKWKT